jgi:hypothetical protein
MITGILFNMNLFLLGLVVYTLFVGIAMMIMGMAGAPKSKETFYGMGEFVFGLAMVMWIIICFLV